MNDDLQPLKNRVRWLNRGILVLGILILLGLIAWAALGLRGSAPGTKSTVVHPASSASNVAARSASAVAASQPKPALSTAQQERNAAAAMNALAAASQPAAATATQASAPAVSSTASIAASTPAAPSAAETTAAAAAASAKAPGVAAAPSTVKPEPKPKHRPTATPVRKAHAPASTEKPRPSGAVGVCRAAGWYVQVGAFGKQQSIDRLARKLHGAGYAQVCVVAKEVRGLRLFYVGPYRNADAARAARGPLRKLTGTEGILRKLP